MADAIDAITDAAAAVVGQLNDAEGAEPAVVFDPEPEPSVAEPSDPAPAADPHAGLSKEQLAERLQSREKSYDELRSLHDRQMSELREQQNALNQKIVESLERQSAARAEPAQPQKSPEELYEEWGEKFMPDDPEMGARIARIVDTVGTARMSEVQSALREMKGSTAQQLTALNPDYRQHKATVDELTAEGMGFDAALAFAKKHATGQPAAQPGNPAVPGRTATDTRANPASPASPPPIRVDAATANALRMAAESVGIKDGKGFVEKQARDVARALQAAS